MQDQENRQYRPDQGVHPAIARLHAELDAARRGIDVLADLERGRRERVVAELLSAVPDVASRAAHEVGADRAVATIQGFDGVRTDDHAATTAVWDRLVLTAVEAAAASADGDGNGNGNGHGLGTDGSRHGSRHGSRDRDRDGVGITDRQRLATA